MQAVELTGPQAWAEIRAVASDRRSGAAQLARRAATALGALGEHELLDAVGVLLEGHPSMAPLWRLGSALLGSDDHAAAARHFVETLDWETQAAAAVVAASLGSASASASLRRDAQPRSTRVITFSYTSM